MKQSNNQTLVKIPFSGFYNSIENEKVATVLENNAISLYDFKEGYMNDNVNLFFGSRQTDYLVIFENEKVANKSHYKKSKLARMNKDDLTNLADEMLGCGFDDSTKRTLIDGLMSITNKDYYTSHYENECYNNLDFDFAISGYSQGDYCKVKIVGNVDKCSNKDYKDLLVAYLDKNLSDTIN